MKIFWKDDGSLSEYKSDFNEINRQRESCNQYFKVDNDNFKLMELLEAQTVKFGHMFDDNDELTTRIYTELEGFNMV